MKHCESARLFDVLYQMNNKYQAISKFVFPNDYSVCDVESVLGKEPHSIKIIKVTEVGSINKINNKYLK